ncbi:hypothetical protein QBC46DRAFT_348815 [Diplogelasinospora grovesii]|uniref:Reverse transcriptase domain-containing protein n=1 Tax=Diplogelasinospora grovesii TaxID=303347 RepID=A0AAN6NI56_9PEZI|nr:hypothetical protein QBC46DRAFT_348815 [Diplogelasinospora grovesii]
MASPTSALSKTLQSITLNKIRELDSRRTSYETRKRDVLQKAEAASNQRDRVACLVDAFRELCPDVIPVGWVKNIEQWLAQSRYDDSIPESKLADFECQLRAKLDIQSRKLDMAHLYSRLLTEWMDQSSSDSNSSRRLPRAGGDKSDDGDPEEDGDNDNFEKDNLELVAERQRQRLSALVDRFETVVFEPLETSDTEIRAFLDKLFPNEQSQKALARLREKVGESSADFMSRTRPFTQESVTACIKGLLAEDLLSDEKRAILRDFLDNEVAKGEIADVLNMRFSGLKQWHWDAGPDGIRVMPRQGLNGKYRIWADDDILQMIFVQYIGVRLCNLVKPALKTFMSEVCVRDLDEHQDVEWERKSAYTDTFFLSQLPASETSLFDGDQQYDDDSDDDESDSEDHAHANTPQQKKSGIKQRLLRHLTAEILMHRLRGVTYDDYRPDGNGKYGVALVQTDLQWYGTSLAHSTIYSVLRYAGFGQDWIDFFKKYLESPLNLDAASEDRPQLGPRIRKRGVPLAHASEKLIGELVLFFLDVAVNRETGIFLYRVHDDIWLCGEPDKAVQAWSCMQAFAETSGLEFNRSKTGSVYLPGRNPKTDHAKIAAALPDGAVTFGFLKLDPSSGKWGIDQTLVKAHLDQLQRQLSQCRSVLSWVQTWNSCIGRFFSHTFGEPAYCFGREHNEETLGTYQKMLRTLFQPGEEGSKGGVVLHLKKMIQDKFGVKDLPDAFIFLPEQLRGLGLRNPFVPLFLVRKRLKDTPEDLLKGFLTGEREHCLSEKKAFESTSKTKLRRRLDDICPPSQQNEKAIPAIKPEEAHTMMSLEEYCRFRERRSMLYRELYNKLVSVPDRLNIIPSNEVRDYLDRVSCNKIVREPQLSGEKKWLLQLYADELLEKYGELSLVDKQFLPVGMLALMREKKVTWQMSL